MITLTILLLIYLATLGFHSLAFYQYEKLGLLKDLKDNWTSPVNVDFVLKVGQYFPGVNVWFAWHCLVDVIHARKVFRQRRARIEQLTKQIKQMAVLQVKLSLDPGVTPRDINTCGMVIQVMKEELERLQSLNAKLILS